MKTPITIITGYLGSGKTTLLKHIIETADRKFAILMNEFGQVGIDTAVIKGKNIDMVELKGGCVCCSMTGEFEAAVREIKEKIDPELIIIETTGVAEPDAIIGDITENIEDVRLDAVVTIVDADAMEKFPSLGYTGRVQIEMADVLLLNKTDLLDDEHLVRIEDVLRKINPNAALFRTTFCTVEPDLILDLNVERKPLEPKEHVHKPDELGLGSFHYESKAVLSKAGLEELLFNMPAEIFRAKGFVLTDEGNFLVNLVFGRVDFEEFITDKNLIVFIGKNVEKHREQILQRIDECKLENNV